MIVVYYFAINMATRKSSPAKPIDLKLTDEEPSLLFAIKELLTNNVNFDEWFQDEWRKGFFPRDQSATNYRQEDWKTPKFKDITPNNSKSGVRTIEYWRDRDSQEVSYILSGTNSDLIRHIIKLEYEGGGKSDTGISGKNSKPPLAGFPAIRLLFVQCSDDMRKNQMSPVIGTKIIRLVGFTENDRVATFGTNIEKLKPTDLKRWSTNIVKIFANYKWEKGQGCLSYSVLSARLQGLEGYAYVKTCNDGIKLFKAMLQIFNRLPDELCFFWSENNNPSKKYAVTDKEVIVLGEKQKLQNQRPVANVVFDSATLILSNKVIIPLVKRNVVIYK